MAKKYSDRQKEIIAKALTVQERYGTRDKPRKDKYKPKLRVRPKGNPLKGEYGFLAEYLF